MIPTELKTQIEKEAEAEMIYEPKYGGKDWSGHEAMMKYEVNDERYEAYEKGALKYAELWQEAKELNDKYKTALKLIEQMSDPGDYFKAIVDMKSIASHALSKSNQNE